MQFVIMGLYYVLMAVVGTLVWMIGVWFVGYSGFFVSSIMSVLGFFFPDSLRSLVSQNLAVVSPYLSFLSIFVDLSVVAFSLNLLVSTYITVVWIRLVRRFLGHFTAFRNSLSGGLGV